MKTTSPTPSAALIPVSVIIPCRNEAKFIERCLASILASDYPHDRLEILVVDGMSDDGTREFLTRYATHHASLSVLDNPKGSIPAAMNIGIRRARGDVIMKMDGHSTYPTTYILSCIRFMHEFDADNVGGAIDVQPIEETLIARAIAAALRHPFGTLNSYFKLGTKEPRWVDAVAFGCFRREVFDRVGLYDERLVRSSDMDLNVRLRQAGRRILLIPETIEYFPKARLGEFWWHNVDDGLWALYPLAFGRRVFSWRHVVPLGLLVLFLAAALGMRMAPALRVMAVGMLVAYLVGSLAASVQIGIRERNWRHLFVLPLVFAIRHAGYAIGSVAGLIAALLARAGWRRLPA